MSKKKAQPEISVGMVGHVDHGKTTLVEALSGKWADTHSEELVRGITIRLGYADVNFYYCETCKEYSPLQKCPCGKEGKEIRKVSLVDAPGHESLMATMLSGANIMDGALLLISATEHCPQPQTKEHLMALEIIGIKHVIIVQNKVDLVDDKKALKNYEEIKEFLQGTAYENAPIIPLSAKHRINISPLIKAIQDTISTPQRDTSKTPLMFVARSFDINKPGSDPTKILGGVLGGAIDQGEFTIGDEIGIIPGYVVTERNQKVWKTITTKITGMMTGGQKVKTVGPGGTIALLTNLDPAVVKSDQLVGSVVGKKENLPKVWNKLFLDITLLERVVGSKDDLIVDPILPKELLMMNVNAAATVGVVQEVDPKKMKCTLKRPVAAEVGSRVTLSRMVGRRWRLIGYGIIRE
jgi:translation initiation factor 2 subunit 3